jgi:hypothetical protein
MTYRSAAAIAVPGIFDFLLLALTLIKGIRTIISLKGDSSSSLVCEALLEYYVEN